MVVEAWRANASISITVGGQRWCCAWSAANGVRDYSPDSESTCGLSCATKYIWGRGGVVMARSQECG
jgi:hypothetical protein